MVHALQKTAQLLDRAGMLIEAHDVPEPSPIEVRTPTGVRVAGWLLDHTDFVWLHQTDSALDVVIENGLFAEASCFEYLVHAGSLEAFQTWLEAKWESSYFPDAYARIVKAEMSRAAGDAEVVIRAKARMVRLMTIQRPKRGFSSARSAKS